LHFANSLGFDSIVILSFKCRNLFKIGQHSGSEFRAGKKFTAGKAQKIIFRSVKSSKITKVSTK